MERSDCNFLIFQGTERINFANSYNDRITMDEFGTLHIKDVTQDDNAKYICRAENGYGNFVTGSSWLKVRRKSRIVVPPKHALYKVKTNFSLIFSNIFFPDFFSYNFFLFFLDFFHNNFSYFVDFFYPYFCWRMNGKIRDYFHDHTWRQSNNENWV